MPKCIVIADDLTGGNATGALFAKRGLNTYCTVDTLSNHFDVPDKCDVLVHVTCSRQMSQSDAYSSVANAIRALKSDEILIYNKRIDSTLRGNVAAETDAMLDFLGEEYIAAVVAVHPSAGRIVREGQLYVNGQPLHESPISTDPLSPVTSCKIENIFIGITKYKTAVITAKEYLLGRTYVIDHLKTLYKKDVRIIIFDGTSEEDLEFISRALLTSNLKFITVDPGLFTMICSDMLIWNNYDHRTLLLIGSVYPQVLSQVQNLQNHSNSFIAFLKTSELVHDKKRRNFEIDRVVNEVLACKEKMDAYAVIGDGIFPENIFELEPYAKKLGISKKELTESIADGFGLTAKKILSEDKRFDTLFTCGGDITFSVCSNLGAKALKTLDEVAPLVACSELLGGSHSGIRLISKGGAIGNCDCLLTALNYSRIPKRGK